MDVLFEVCWIIASNIDRLANKLLPSFSHESLARNSIELESMNSQGNEHKSFGYFIFKLQL